jgi:hypothetical protein
VPFFALAPGVRKMIYTTNAVEALHRSLRKIIKTCGSFPNDEAALKLLYLTIRNASLPWGPAIQWTAALGSLPFSSANAFREPDDENTRHHGNVHDRMVRTFAVKPSRLSARPLRGVGA